MTLGRAFLPLKIRGKIYEIIDLDPLPSLDVSAKELMTFRALIKILGVSSKVKARTTFRPVSRQLFVSQSLQKQTTINHNRQSNFHQLY